MTNKEAIEVIKLALAQVEWDYPMDYAAAFDMAIKALEQEPMVEIDLYSVIKQKYIEREVLDKIRAEILEEHENAYAREDYDTAYGLSMALDILDKYKAETEAEYTPKNMN